MTLDEIENLADRVRTANASVKFGHPKYIASVNSQSLLQLLDGIRALLPVVRAAEDLNAHVNALCLAIGAIATILTLPGVLLWGER